MFFDTTTFQLEATKLCSMTLVPKRLRGEMAAFDIMDGDESDRRSRVVVLRRVISANWKKAGESEAWKCPMSTCTAKSLAKNVVDAKNRRSVGRVQH